MKIEEIRVCADLTVELTKLRQSECKHLSIENIGPEIFHALLVAFQNAQPIVMGVPSPIRFSDPTSGSGDDNAHR